MSPTAPILHATAIAWFAGGEWRGVLLRGASGAGKSDLALRALALGWRLVADDRAIAWASGGRLYVRAPAPLSGLIEARHLGPVPARPLSWAEVSLVVDLAADATSLERVPSASWTEIEGVRLPCVALAGREASGPAKLALALGSATLGAGREAAYLTPSADEA